MSEFGQVWIASRFCTVSRPFHVAVLFLLATSATGTVQAVDIPSFADSTAAAGLSFSHSSTLTESLENQMMTPGVAVSDFNRDGFLDLFVQGGTGQNVKLFINNGDGTFQDQALAWGIDLTSSEGGSVAVGDIDGNGYPDIFVGDLILSSSGGRNYVFLNDGQGGFSEIGVASGLGLPFGASFSASAFGGAFGDYDLDGDLDFVKADWGQTSGPLSANMLFRNNGDSTFTDVSLATGVFQSATKIWGFSPALVDLNNDRYPELALAGDFGTSEFYENNGDGTFLALTNNGTTTDENGMGSAFADVDNDGDLDWFVTAIFDDDGVVEANWGTTGNRLYRNDGNNQFTDITDLAGVRNADWGWGASFGDLNHDGLVDLLATNGFRLPGSSGNPDPTFDVDPVRLWLNNGDFLVGPAFVEAAAAAGITDTAYGKGLLTFDSDNDGDLDVVITNNFGALKFYANNMSPDPTTWLQIELLAPSGNAPDGIGAKIDIQVGGVTYHRSVHSAPSFMSQESYRVHFGFPSSATVSSVVVSWPDGSATTLNNIDPGQILRILAGDINASGGVNGSDLVLAIRFASGLIIPSPSQKVRADMNLDGVVNVADVLLLTQQILSN